MNKNVYIEGERNGSYHDMWMRWGWNVVRTPFEASVIQFTGGEDVNPALYDEAPHPKTYFSQERDEICIEIYQIARANGIKMAGICRGGQILNVLNGGKMFQHCDGHGVWDTHKATILESGLVVDVTSTHHQIMRPNRDKGIVLMEAEKLGTYKEHMEHYVHDSWRNANKPDEDDVESIFYPDTMSLCYQPHSEYVDFNHPCQKVYRYFLRNYLEIDVPC